MGAAKRRHEREIAGQLEAARLEVAMVDQIVSRQKEMLPRFFASMNEEEERDHWVIVMKQLIAEQKRLAGATLEQEEEMDSLVRQGMFDEMYEVEKRLAQDQIGDPGYYQSLSPELKRRHRTHLHRTIVHERAQAILTKRKQQEEQSMAEAKVRFFKDGDAMGIQTSAIDERTFIQECALGIGVMIEEGQFDHDWEFQLQGWLPQIVDIVCKLRGYKADVHEERVITAGYANWGMGDLRYPRGEVVRPGIDEDPEK